MDAAFTTTEQFLATVPLFATLESGDIARLARGSAIIDLPRGAVVFRQGDPCSGLHIVMRGQVKLAMETADGQEKVIDLLGRGASFGEIPIFLETNYLFSAQALCESRVLRLGRARVLEEVRRSRELAQQLILQLCDRLYRRTIELGNYVMLNGTQRVANYLLNQCNGTLAEAPAVLLLPTRKGVIASQLNLTQAHFSRVLRALASEGLIEVRGRKVRIRDVAQLRERAGQR